MGSKKLWIDCVAGSQLKDTQGEILNVEGADISDLEAGCGRWNDNHGKGFFNSLGRITEAKKIFKAEDCDNDRQKYYWEQIKAPYIYAKGYLYSGEDHQNAKAAAAIIRNINKTDAPLRMKASVEGGVLARGLKDKKLLARTKIHSIALTFTPANNATLVEPLDLSKTEYNQEADYELIKSVMHLAEADVPSFRHIARTATANRIVSNLNRIEALAKDAGIDIVIGKSTAEQLVQKAVKDKIKNNMEEINKAVKRLRGGMTYVPETDSKSASKPSPKYNIKLAEQKEASSSVKGGFTPHDKFQQQIGTLKTSPVPKIKSDPKGITGTGSGSIKVKSNLNPKDVYAKHAKIAGSNTAHLGNIQKQLKASGASSSQINAVISKLKGLNKSENLEKGEGTKAIKNLVLAGALAVGANNISPNTKEKIKEHDIYIHPVTRKYYKDKKYKNEIKDLDAYRSSFKKALSAGYGGAGSPTGVTHGGVLQSESLEDGITNQSFKYVTCDKCGNEQLQASHQVKCRKCGKNFSLAKVFDMINK